MQLLLVCSPGAFLAFNYIVYGRFIRHRIGDRFSAIKPRLVARLFILSDILCFLVQVRRSSHLRTGVRLMLVNRVPEEVCNRVRPLPARDV